MKHPRDILRANLARAKKRVGRSSTMVQGRQYAIAVEGTRITFECKRAGHRYTINYSLGPVHKRLSEDACKRMASWWSREKGGCIGACPTCEKSTTTKP